MTQLQRCPCCASFVEKAADTYRTCPICSHRWRNTAPDLAEQHYRSLDARNDVAAPWYRRKTESRLAAIRQLMAQKKVWRILEVGCAEGGLGGQLKGQQDVVYEGVELSRDAETAARSLDRVFTEPAARLGQQPPYDLIVSFHVLEHVADPAGELAAWRGLLTSSGRLIVEVPNRAGHPLLDDDRNREHLHQFSPASLSRLVEAQQYEILQLTTGNYESPVYPDSIRLVARPKRPARERRATLIARFRETLGRQFIVHGIGGDFSSYVEPLADELDIATLIDTSPEKHGLRRAGHVVEAYDPARHSEGSILICSIRFASEIRRSLIERGVAEERMIGLEEIYDPSPSGH